MDDLDYLLLSEHKFVDLLYDDLFKMVFTKPENNGLLLTLLRTVLPELGIYSVEVKDTEQTALARGRKRSTFDVSCTTDGGSSVVVEVQHRFLPDYLDRMVYYSSFPILKQHAASDKNYTLTPVYIVSFINFAIGHGPEWKGDLDIISRYSIREDHDGELMTDALHFVFVELGRFKKSISELETESDWWFYCLKSRKEVTDIPHELEYESVKGLLCATIVADLNATDKENYIRFMTTERDIEIWKDMARQEGLEKGRAEGREEGREEGVVIGKAQIIRKIQELGVDASIIAKLVEE